MHCRESIREWRASTPAIALAPAGDTAEVELLLATLSDEEKARGLLAPMPLRRFRQRLGFGDADDDADDSGREDDAGADGGGGAASSELLVGARGCERWLVEAAPTEGEVRTPQRLNSASPAGGDGCGGSLLRVRGLACHASGGSAFLAMSDGSVQCLVASYAESG